MQRDVDDDDDISTPSTTRSNSIGENEDDTSSRPPAEETVQSTASASSGCRQIAQVLLIQLWPLFVEETPPADVHDQANSAVAAQRMSFVSSSSSSESDTDFVAVNESDVNADRSTPSDAVSLLVG